MCRHPSIVVMICGDSWSMSTGGKPGGPWRAVGVGSGQCRTPCERMHWANFRIPLSSCWSMAWVDPLLFGNSDGRADRRVVVIEDEQPVREAVLSALRVERFRATAFEDLPRPGDVLAVAPDLAILDVLLPSGNGFELASLLRQQYELPIIFLTARDTVADRVAGLDLGADDYLVKPFALES